jgi:hypothetical protein
MKLIRKLGDILLHTICALGCIALFLVLVGPKGAFEKLPGFLGLPLAIDGLLFFCIYVGYKAYPLLRDIFGPRPDQTTTSVDNRIVREMFEL